MKKLLSLLIFVSSVNASVIQERFKKDLSKVDFLQLRSQVLAKGSYAAKDLVTVISEKSYPIKSRWQSIFLLGQIMGVKSAPYLKKLTLHSDLMIRLAALKTMYKLSISDPQVYSRMLFDDALIIRSEVLKLVESENLKNLADDVWRMMFDPRNYSSSDKGQTRSPILKKVVKLVGDLNFLDAKPALKKMIVSKKYDDLFDELDYSLSRLTSLESKGESLEQRRKFWVSKI